MQYRKHTFVLVAVTFVGLALAFSVGCGKTPVAGPADTNRLKAIGILYGKYVSAHNGQMPASEQEFLQFISTRERSLMNQFGVDDPAKLLLPPREGKPIVIVTGKGRLLETTPFVAYEAEPVDGTRFVARTVGSVKELNEEDFQAQQKPNG